MNGVCSCPTREGRGGTCPDNGVPSSDQDWSRKIGDVLLCTFDVLTMDHYIKYLDAHAAILERLELAVMQDTRYPTFCINLFQVQFLNV